MHPLHLKSLIDDRGEGQGPRREEVRQLADVVLALEREPPILQPCVEGDLVVVELLHGRAGSERVGVERIDPVGEFDLRRVGRNAVIRIARLSAVADRRAEARGQGPVIFEIAEPTPGAELTGRRHGPHARTVRKVARVVTCRHAELADVRVDGEVVEPARYRLSGQEYARRESPAEEIFRHLPVARSPEGPRALD